LILVVGLLSHCINCDISGQEIILILILAILLDDENITSPKGCQQQSPFKLLKCKEPKCTPAMTNHNKRVEHLGNSHVVVMGQSRHCCKAKKKHEILGFHPTPPLLNSTLATILTIVGVLITSK
jgi:hypothetical protein